MKKRMQQWNVQVQAASFNTGDRFRMQWAWKKDLAEKWWPDFREKENHLRR